MAIKQTDFNVLIIDDQPNSINRFIRCFENHEVKLDDKFFRVNFTFLQVKLVQDKTDPSRWLISDETIDELMDAFQKDIHLVLLDYAFVPPEKDEELTYKLNHNEIKSKNELFGYYVLDAYQLFKAVFDKYSKAKKKILNGKTKYLLYTYPSDSLMMLLGDAEQRRIKLSKILPTKITTIDTRSILYGGDKELEKHHNRRLYPQLLSGYLNRIILEQLYEFILAIVPQYKNIRIKKSVFAVTLIAAFAGGIGMLSQYLTANIVGLWNENFSLSITLLGITILIVFTAGCSFAILFERIVRNLVLWFKENDKSDDI